MKLFKYKNSEIFFIYLFFYHRPIAFCCSPMSFVCVCVSPIFSRFYFVSLVVYLSGCLCKILKSIFDLLLSDRFSSNIEHKFTVGDNDSFIVRSHERQGPKEKHSFAFFDWNYIIINPFCSNIKHEFIVDDNVIFIYFQRQSFNTSRVGWKKNCAFFSEITYLMNDFTQILCANSLLMILQCSSSSKPYIITNNLQAKKMKRHI